MAIAYAWIVLSTIDSLLRMESPCCVLVRCGVRKDLPQIGKATDNSRGKTRQAGRASSHSLQFSRKGSEKPTNPYPLPQSISSHSGSVSCTVFLSPPLATDGAVQPFPLQAAMHIFFPPPLFFLLRARFSFVLTVPFPPVPFCLLLPSAAASPLTPSRFALPSTTSPFAASLSLPPPPNTTIFSRSGSIFAGAVPASSASLAFRFPLHSRQSWQILFGDKFLLLVVYSCVRGIIKRHNNVSRQSPRKG